MTVLLNFKQPVRLAILTFKMCDDRESYPTPSNSTVFWQSLIMTITWRPCYLLILKNVCVCMSLIPCPWIWDTSSPSFSRRITAPNWKSKASLRRKNTKDLWQTTEWSITHSLNSTDSSHKDMDRRPISTDSTQQMPGSNIFLMPTVWTL